MREAGERPAASAQHKRNAMSSGIYRRSQKVTMVDHFDWQDINGVLHPSPRALPQFGEVYTVDRFHTNRDGEEALIFLEVPLHSFPKKAFRPVVDESVRRSVSWTAPTPTPVDA